VLFSRRWSYHVSKLSRNQHHCRHLQAAWNKYSAENFKFVILQEVVPETLELTKAEQIWMDHYAAVGKLYNKVKTPRTPEHLQKMSEARKGKKQSEETKAKKRDKSQEPRSLQLTKEKPIRPNTLLNE
jgi:hypothetical protein